MAQHSGVNYGVYVKTPLYHFFRNGCVPALSAIIVREFKNTHFVSSLLNKPLVQSPEPQAIGTHDSVQCRHFENPVQNVSPLKRSHTPPTNFQGPEQKNQVLQYESIRNMTVYECLNIIHRKGKREEGKRRKEEERRRKEEEKRGKNEVDSSSKQVPDAFRTLHLNNLKDNEEALSKVPMSQLLETQACEEAIENLKDIDMTFLLNLLTNDILQFQLDDKVLETIGRLKEIRNDVAHSGCTYASCDVDQQLRVLCENTKILFQYLNISIDVVEKIRNESQIQIEKKCERFSQQILGEMRKEVHGNYINSNHHVFPSITYSRGDSQSTQVIENLERCIMDCKAGENGEARRFLMCGAPGVGKTSILQNLSDTLCENSDFLLVLYFDTSSRMIKGTMSLKKIYESVKTLCAVTVSKYGMDLVENVIKMYSDQIIFIVDWNITCLGDIMHDTQQGTWIITYQGTPETCTDCHILKVLPLDETQVEQILRSINDTEDRLLYIVKIYKECHYKGLLSSPDMVRIFNEIGSCVSCDELLYHFIHRKVHSIENFSEELMKLGEIAFNMIGNNKKYYSNSDLSYVNDKVMKPFLEYHKNGAHFKYTVIEDYLAARYVITKPEIACKKWLKQVPLFKRVFRFACAGWCANEANFQSYLPVIKSYLLKYLDLQNHKKKEKKTNRKNRGKKFRRQSSDGESHQEEPMDVDESEDVFSTSECSYSNGGDDFSRKNHFTKWSYLIKLAENCHFQPKILELMGELLSYKQSWHFKCKILDESKIEKVAEILKYAKVINPLTIKIESGSNVKLLNQVWNMLSTLTGLKQTHVQIMIIRRDNLPIPHGRMLMELSNLIARNHNNPLYITKFIGPLVCSETPQFLKCLCLRNVEVLDLCVYDVATLHEILSYTELSCLRDVIIKVDLKAEEQALVDTVRFMVPKSAPLTLRIKYFDRLQNMLDRFESPLDLTSLSIYDVYIHENFRLDLSRFKNLICLFMTFVPGEKTAYTVPDLPFDQAMMEVSEIRQGRIKLMPLKEWVFHLSVHLILPKGLERLLLRNMEFCSNSNSFSLLRYWKNCHMQRLIIDDSSLSIAGVRSILKSHVESSGDEGLEQVLKKVKIDKRPSLQLREWLKKVPRLKREEREERRQNKPDGKELIITSNFSLCQGCRKFPCSCTHLNEADRKENLEDLIYLIEDTYTYDILSFSFTCEMITIRKDLCGDLRVHCPLTGFKDDNLYGMETDDVMHGCEEPESYVYHLFQTLTLAQCICLGYTDLTHKGAMKVIKILKERKVCYSGLGYVEPFSLTIKSTYHPKSMDEIVNSVFLKFLEDEDCLVQFNFCCCCSKRCHHIKKTRAGKFFINNEPYNKDIAEKSMGSL